MSTALEPPRRPYRRPRVQRVLILSGSVGAGHDGAAHELASRLRSTGVVAVVRDFLDALAPWCARLLRDGYTRSVGHAPAAFEFLFRHLEHQGLLWRAEEAICAAGDRAVQSWLAETGPDVVVSTYPLASQCLGEMRADGRLRVPLFTYLTDPAVHRSWVHPAADGHLTVTEATARQGAADYGVPMAAAGPLVPARFAAPAVPARLAQLRAALGLPLGLPVALVVAGSLGVGDLLPTVRAVAAAGLVPVALCGRNEALRRRVTAEPGALGLGWRDDMAQLMQMSDVLVHNAGGLSFTEALVTGLPAVTYRPIPGHGRANAAVLDRSGLAPWAHSPAQLADAVHQQLARGRIPCRLPDPTDTVLAALVHQAPTA
jgi:processive 1,2-diacylglycerol beta-glucosyltransferase